MNMHGQWYNEVLHLGWQLDFSSLIITILLERIIVCLAPRMDTETNRLDSIPPSLSAKYVTKVMN
jgi:hypothetical protein